MNRVFIQNWLWVFDCKKPPPPGEWICCVVSKLRTLRKNHPPEEQPPKLIGFRILKGGSSSSGFLIWDPPNKETPPWEIFLRSNWGWYRGPEVLVISRMLSWVQKMTLPGQQSVWIWKFQFEFCIQADLTYLYWIFKSCMNRHVHGIVLFIFESNCLVVWCGSRYHLLELLTVAATQNHRSIRLLVYRSKPFQGSALHL